MKYLEFTDVNNIRKVIPLFKSLFYKVNYPLVDEVPSATLYTNDNRIVTVVGTNFKMTTDKK